MNLLKGLTAILVVTVGWAGTAGAEPMLTGASTYDALTHLYTLDDRSAAAPIDIALIRVATPLYDLNKFTPNSFSAPRPFSDFHLSTAADIKEDETVFASGVVYDWLAGPTVMPGVYNFSFTSQYAPRTGMDSNYELFASSLYDADHDYDARVEVGHVVAPELAIANTPEPGTLAFVFTGFAAVGFRRSWPPAHSSWPAVDFPSHSKYEGHNRNYHRPLDRLLVTLGTLSPTVSRLTHTSLPSRR